MLAGVAMAKRAPDGALMVDGHEEEIVALFTAAYGRSATPKIIGYVRRAGQVMKKISDVELRDANCPFFPHPNARTHRGNQFSDVAKLTMLLALMPGCSGDVNEERLLKAHTMMRKGISPSATLEALAKDFGDDSDDEDDDGEDDSGNDGGSDAGDDGNDSGGTGNGHYNPDEPRIPAGQPGGGQWTTGDGTSTDAGSISADDVRNTPDRSPSSTREYQVAQRTDVATDAAPTGSGNNANTGNIPPNASTSVNGTLTRLDTVPLAPDNNVLPYFNSSITNQVSGFFSDAQQQGIPIQMTSGFRSSDAQADLTGNQYGGAASGSSLHEAGFAFDVNWNQLSSAQQSQLLDIAQQHNLQWGGAFNTPDPVHFYSDPFDSVAARRAYIPQAQEQYRALQGANR